VDIFSMDWGENHVLCCGSYYTNVAPQIATTPIYWALTQLSYSKKDPSNINTSQCLKFTVFKSPIYSKIIRKASI